MRNIDKLTKEELDKFILDNLNLAYYLAEKFRNRFDNSDEFEDFKQDVIVRYVRVCQIYDDSKGFMLSTLLSRAVLNEFINSVTDVRSKGREYIRRKEMTYSMDNAMNGYDSFHEMIPDSKSSKTIQNRLLIKEILEDIKNNFSLDEYKTFILYVMYGLNQNTISEITNVPQCYVSRRVRKIRNYINEKYKYC